MEDDVLVHHCEPLLRAYHFHKMIYQGMVIPLNLLFIANCVGHKALFGKESNRYWWDF